MRAPFLGPLCDHLDVRVRDLDRARTFYDPFCAALGLSRIDVGALWIVYESPDSTLPFLAITADACHKPCGTRVAFRAASNGEVDRIAGVARIYGAANFEQAQPCPEYAPGYYASFFDDPDGNKYEVCWRPSSPTIARVWRGRVRDGLLDEYRDYVASTGLADYLSTEGNRGACLLTAVRKGFGDVLTVSFWDSYEAIARFAGGPIDRARYYLQDERFLLDPPEAVEHFDATFATGSARTSP